MLHDFEFLLNQIVEIKKEAEREEVYAISILMDDYIKQFTKSIWMIKQVISE